MLFLPLQITELSGSQAIIIAIAGFFLVIVVLMVLALFVKLLSTIVGKAANKSSEPAHSAPETKTADAPTKAKTESEVVSKPAEYNGYVTLDGVSEQDAAAIMAITAHKLKKSVEELQFSSIKRLDQDPVLEGISEQDAAVVMAITANRLNKPLENLDFKYIRLVEE